MMKKPTLSAKGNEKEQTIYVIDVQFIEHLFHSVRLQGMTKRALAFLQVPFGPSDWIRTSGLLNPIQARYQTSPHPEIAARFQTA